MNITTDSKLVIKHTFLEFVDEQGSCVSSRRQRSSTEPCVDAACVYETTSQSESTSCGSSDDESEHAKVSSGGAQLAWMPTTPEFSPLLYPSYSSQPALFMEECLPLAFTTEEIAMWQYTACQSWLSMPHDCSAYGSGYLDAPHESQGVTCWAGADHPPKPDCTVLPTIAENETPASLETRTSVMLRGVPLTYTRADLLALLDVEGFYGRVNFVYLPIDFKKQKNLGYALVNLVSPAEAVRLSKHFNGFCKWQVPCDNVCETAWCDPHQGLEAHIERYRNSPVMHESVPEEWRPLLLCHGVPLSFPAPTMTVKAPKLKGK